jgi:hypothetical protein
MCSTTTAMRVDRGARGKFLTYLLAARRGAGKPVSGGTPRVDSENTLRPGAWRHSEGARKTAID